MIAALPQHVWETAAGALALYLMGFGILRLASILRSQGSLKGDSAGAPAESQGNAGRDTRTLDRLDSAMGVLELLAGVGLAVAVFLIDPDLNCVPCERRPWGGPELVAATALWLALLGWPAYRRLRRHTGRSELPRPQSQSSA